MRSVKDALNGMLVLMSEAFIVSAVRTPVGVGKPGGALSHFHPVDLSVLVLQESLHRASIDPGQVDDVILGCVTPIGDQGANIARLAVLKAGFPPEVPAVTLNRMCGSGQQAIHFAAQAILAGDMDIVIAGGTEMMSHQPIGSDWPQEWPADFPYPLVHQGISAEMMAEKWHLSRDELDDFSFQSHLRAMSAIQDGRFDGQVLPLPSPDGTQLTLDEGVRMPPDRQKMAALKPVFKQGRCDHRGQLQPDQRWGCRPGAGVCRERSGATIWTRWRGWQPAPSPVRTRCLCWMDQSRQPARCSGAPGWH